MMVFMASKIMDVPSQKSNASDQLPLSNLVNNKNLGKMIEAAWNVAIAEFNKQIAEEIKKINNEKHNPQTLIELADKIEKKKYMTLVNIKFNGPQDLLKNYQERIKNLANLGDAERLREAAAIMEETGNKISFTPVVSVNKKLIDNLTKYKGEFVKNTTELLKNAAKGEITTFEIKINDPETAALFKAALEKIGYNPPEGDRKEFKEAKIPAGKYPLEIKLEEDKIIITWPEGISVGAAKNEFGLNLSDIVPKKA